MHIPFSKTVLSLVTFIFLACSPLASAKSSQSKPVTAKEIALGASQYVPTQQAQGAQYTVDPALNAYVKRIGLSLAKASEFPDLPYDFVVINNGELNAWALPGGKIGINRGLLSELQDEAQLASVLAHEIAHVTKRHSARMQNKALGANLLGALIGVGVGLKAPQYQDLAMQGFNIAAYGATASYSREYELQADSAGMKMMAAAGYDPAAAVELQEIFLRESKNRKNSAISQLFASHPPSQERIQANKVTASKLAAGGMRGKAEYQKATAQLIRDKPSYQYLKETMQAYNAKTYPQALALSEKAIALQPKEPLFWEIKGQILSKQGRSKDSIPAFNRAVDANPQFYRPLVLRGLAYKELGQWQQAETSLVASQQLLPTQTATYHLGELALRRNDRTAAREYFTKAAQGGGDLGQAAQRQLQNMQYGN
jgi:predicted Zn-dependent protease